LLLLLHNGAIIAHKRDRKRLPLTKGEKWHEQNK